MEHQMGLASFTLATTTKPTTVTYLNNSVSSSSGTNTITASNSFSGFTPYNNSGTYLYLIRPATSISLNSSSGTDQWGVALTYNIAAGAVDTKEAKSKRHSWPATSKAVWNYDYQGRTYLFGIPVSGKYKLEVWGAAGALGRNGVIDSGDAQAETNDAGAGGYSYGTINATWANLYVTVGGRGGSPPVNTSTATGAGKGGAAGFNGGGAGTYPSERNTNGGDSRSGGGGGGTDIAYHGVDQSDNWNTAWHLYSRIIVAGGGGSTSYDQSDHDGYGGGTSGGTGQSSTGHTSGAGGGPTSGGTGAVAGTFGIGASPSQATSNNAGGAGGGGWYGGGAGANTPANNRADGGGGSGYVYTATTASNYPSGCSLSSDQYLENDAATLAGNVEFNAPDGTKETGHSGNGYARITWDASWY